MNNKNIKIIFYNANRCNISEIEAIKKEFPHIKLVQKSMASDYKITTNRSVHNGKEAEIIVKNLIKEIKVYSDDEIATDNNNLINILIRTSNRPNGFARIIDNIRSQTYKNYRIIVSVDNDETEEYVRKYKDVEYIRLEHVKKTAPEHCPYNLYFNSLIDKVDDGWIFFVDDDDTLNGPNTLNIINANVSDPSKMYIFRMNYDNRRIIPGVNFNKNIVVCDIATPNILIHKSKATLSKWPGKRMGDFAYISGLVDAMGKSSIVWVNKITYNVDLAGEGKRSDITYSKPGELPLS